MAEEYSRKEVAVYRKGHFNAAHRLFVPGWTDEQNFAVFGPCSYPHYHGHNYEVIVKVIGVPDPVTGFVIDLGEVSRYLKEEITSRFDHKNLNLDTEFFKDLYGISGGTGVEIVVGSEWL